MIISFNQKNDSKTVKFGNNRNEKFHEKVRDLRAFETGFEMLELLIDLR